MTGLEVTKGAISGHTERLGVQSRHLMDRIQGEPFGFDCPLFADELVRSEAFERLQSSPEVVGADEVGKMISELVVIVVVEAFDGRLLDRAVHAFDLAICPRVPDLGEPMFDLMLAANAVEDVFEGINMPVVIGELDAIACWE